MLLAITLAWVGGYTNIVTLLSCGTVVSHVSGTTSNFGRQLFAGSWPATGYLLFLLTTFFTGACVAGLSAEIGRRHRWHSIFMLPMILETALLSIFAGTLEMVRHPGLQTGDFLYWMTGLASAAMGLQNATISRISDGQVRTTHVTGVLTDLGNEGTQFIFWLFTRRRDLPAVSNGQTVRAAPPHVSARRLVLLASIISTFALGAGLGAVVYHHQPRLVMLPPVIFLFWLIYQDASRPIAGIEPSDLIDSIGGIGLPGSLAIFHLRHHGARTRQAHRMPNLLNWSESLPDAARVIVLDVGQMSELDTNAAFELRALLVRFRQQGRELVIAGVDYQRFIRINPGADPLLSLDNICPDVDLAIARAMNLLEGSALAPQ